MRDAKTCSSSVIAAVTAMVLASGVQAEAAPTASRTLVPPGKMYIGNAFALSGDASRLVYVVTDGEQDAHLHLVDLGPSGTDSEIASIKGQIDAIRWITPERVLVVMRKNATATVFGRIFTAAGPVAGEVGPADNIGVARLATNTVISTFTKSKASTYTVAAFSPDDLRPLGNRTIALDKRRQFQFDGQLATLLWWSDDFTVAAVRHPGQYDKARDLRLPDRFGRVDLLTGSLIDDAAIDRAGFARLASIQRLYPGRSTFVHVDSVNQKLLLVDGVHSRELLPSRPLRIYDPGTVQSQVMGPDEVMVSLTGDPLNPDAVARKKRDHAQLELYSANRSTGAISPRLVLDVGSRPTSWQAAQKTVVVLRKHRVFARGGVALEVHALADERAPDH